MTFEEEDAVHIALQETGDAKAFANQPLKFTTAPEPTDIIWENRFLSEKHQILKRELVAYLGIMLVLMFSFVVIFRIAVSSQRVLNTFPEVDCSQIEATFGS